MQERNRESRKRNHKLKPGSSSVSKNRKNSKPKELTPVEKRNQRIQENRKKGRRADNRETIGSSRESRSVTPNKRKKFFRKKPNVNENKPSLSNASSYKPKSISIKNGKPINLIASRDFEGSEYVFFGAGFVISYLLLLTSSVDTVISEGLFFIYLGTLLLRRPRLYSMGSFVNIFAIGIVLYSLSAFLPNWQNFFSSWRTSASNEYDISLGFFNTILPMKSLEGVLVLVASISIFYHIACWKLNNLGREALFIIIIGVTIFSGGIHYFMGHDPLAFLFSENYVRSPIKDYLDNLNFLFAIGGISSVALFFDSYKSNKAISVYAFSGLLIALFLLIHSEAFFHYTLLFIGSFLLIIRLYLKDRPLLQKFCTWILLLSCFSLGIYLNSIWWDIFVYDFGGFILARGRELWWLLIGSFKDLNIFGNGIATAHSILPQLSHLEYFKDAFSYQSLDIRAYFSDFGFIGIVALILFFYCWVSDIFRGSKQSKIRHRFFYALVVMVFLMRFLMLSKSMSVGLLLLMLIFLRLSLRNEKDCITIFGKGFCQLMGVFWLCVGMFYVSVSISNQPLLYDIRYRLSYADQCDENLNFKDISVTSIEEKDAYISKTNPSKYFLKAYQLLESKADQETIIKTLNQATFFDQNNPKIFLNFGYLLSEYDLNLAIDVWLTYFEENPMSKFDDYMALIYYSKDKYELLLSLNKLSLLANEYAVEFALSLNRLDFQKYLEVNSIDQFFISNKNSQFQFLKRLLEEGFFEKFDTYISEYQYEIDDIAFLNAIREKELANFDNALFILRKYILPKRIDVYKVNDDKKYIPRVFLQNYPDLEMGAILIKKEINSKNYEKALIYVEHILTMNNPPKYAYYWKAELLYRVEDYVDSWFAFVTYLEKSNVRQFSNKR